MKEAAIRAPVKSDSFNPKPQAPAGFDEKPAIMGAQIWRTSHMTRPGKNWNRRQQRKQRQQSAAQKETNTLIMSLYSRLKAGDMRRQ